MRENKILLFGFSRSAIEIGARLQAQGHAFICIDNDPTLLPKAKKLGFELLVADYSDDDTLLSLGIGEDVKFVFTLFEEDVQNVFLTLSIRSLDPKVEIIATTHTKDAIHKLEIAGASTILDPYQICGKRIYKLITQPEVMQVIDATIFGEEDINMEQITISAHSPLNGLMLQTCYPTQNYNMLLIGLHDKELKKEFIFSTEGHDHKLDAGDILVVVGKSAEIERFKMDFSL
ncbi:potassium channel family protein [Sulfurospirillum oryzae]|uniref:potassium channel family protein n=1 Tax=Sulfurospirillum oryzae TaxID=2976535 RepID=UPI0021E7F7C8|nr:NAD-binding protein [Sulfurospirillum oryzae]